MTTESITLEINGTREVTIPLNFSDFTAAEIKRVHGLIEEDDGPQALAVACIFVRTGLEDADYEDFKTDLLPMFDGDTSMVTWR